MATNMPGDSTKNSDGGSHSPTEKNSAAQEDHSQQYIQIIGTLPDDFPVQYLVDKNGQQRLPQFKIPPQENLLSEDVQNEAKDNSMTLFESLQSNNSTKSKENACKYNMENFYPSNKSFSNDCAESVDSSTKDFSDRSSSSYEELSETFELDCLKSEDSLEEEGKRSLEDLSSKSNSQYEVVQVIKCRICQCLFENRDVYQDHACGSLNSPAKRPTNYFNNKKIIVPNEAMEENNHNHFTAKEDTPVDINVLPSDSSASQRSDSSDVPQIYILGHIKEGDTPPHQHAALPPTEVTRKTDNCEEDTEDIGDSLLIPVRRTKKTLGCPKGGCRAKFSCSPNREIHIKCHREDKRDGKAFQCHICSLPFKCWVKTQNHLWSVHHTDVEMLSCESCGEYRTSTHHVMRTHTLTHLPQKQFKCEECSAEFSQSAQLINHRRKHSPDSNVTEKRKVKRDTSVKRNHCEHCSYKCYNLNDLKKHIMTHTSESPYQCPKCGQSFRDGSALRRHLLLIHIPLKLLSCPMCSYETSLASKFSSHFTKSHQGRETVFVCKICDTEMQSLSQYCHHSLSHRTDLLKQIDTSHST